ncbi:hypothetical protein BSQ39_10740 [Loigolactobacillus backii]|uniref:hypothetical protein n=1 Tax=Loigolactobacillus backii TaxID=375175 RepID=UPI0007F0B03E|nr:hypothetical protein [Loigolactobacillus backii]ANK59026.1 hypothetical protein AYR52_01345 [Loigolactobacillus backii]ANK64014.1 hypothetical protein AYR54_01330 [Loigolactobacillus backii]ANK66463.1 hypothetical protein AYR55_01345 [Loigolactobacillus backii]OLF69849.1 hypothetical protein ACX53_05770 [Loigolactobacillus backii]PIO84008.1 hypothetical protein BSQ39_10740 [Loigolactobacillus backii]
MSKAQQLKVHYAHVVDSMIQTTQNLTGQLNGDYELIKQAIATDTVGEIANDQWLSIKKNFNAGVADYQKSLKTLKDVRPPAKAMGLQHSLLTAYTDYVAGCGAMADAVDAEKHTVDVAAFTSAEQQQDQASEAMNKQVSRLSSVLS